MALHTISLVFATITVGWIAVGMALTMWGLKLFKIFIMILGGVIGFGIGIVMGMAMGGTGEAILLGLLLGIVGAFIAWPLQKLLVFIGVGGMCVVVTLSLVLVRTFSPKTALMAAIIAFIIGGTIALLLYEYLIVILFAASGADMVFQLVAPTPLRHVLVASASGEGMTSLLSATLAHPKQLFYAYAHHLLAYIMLMAIFISFALYFQKLKAYREKDDGVTRREKYYLRRATYLYSLLSLASVAGGYFIGAGTSLALTADITHNFGIDVISWPIISVAAAWLVNLLSKKYDISSDKPVVLGIIAIFGATALPAVNSIVLGIWRFLVRGTREILPSIWQQLTGYYQGFVFAAPKTAGIQIVFLTGSILIMWFILVKGTEKFRVEHTPERHPYHLSEQPGREEGGHSQSQSREENRGEDEDTDAGSPISPIDH